MEIRKRNGESVPFQQEKIFNAMKKAFDGQGREIGSREMDELLATVLNHLSGGYSFYQVVTQERQTARSAYPCGMEKLTH